MKDALRLACAQRADGSCGLMEAGCDEDEDFYDGFAMIEADYEE